jgi:hypothetical protein
LVNQRNEKLQRGLQKQNVDADFEAAIRAMLSEDESALSEETVAENAKTGTRVM